MSKGIQTQVNAMQAPAVAGDWADGNPRAFVDAGQGALVDDRVLIHRQDPRGLGGTKLSDPNVEGGAHALVLHELDEVGSLALLEQLPDVPDVPRAVVNHHESRDLSLQRVDHDPETIDVGIPTHHDGGHVISRRRHAERLATFPHGGQLTRRVPASRESSVPLVRRGGDATP